ncbi:SusC/RagA family TonB-linked outer membrane protein [Sphingobacterium griseoflavum]|uniref:SusC/RagA family TonB-linked outer membrane protein n=1 Tax=Sphingobacterium griseoflavum TaxID=1474952 RepID=A0ABQ3HXJ3_9SPHI|nr:SusC/RagA family TonB-linked outer membrane protein [Sphingobacterium griseoflavum]GHE35793.1 SusC/RagA family TonB-linked outer membrane protein [Sphingobacterium griseoflavum]
MKWKFNHFGKRMADTFLPKDFSSCLSILALCGLLLSGFIGTVTAQRITLHEKKSSMYSILEKIRKQANVDLIGDLSLLENSKPINIQVEDIDIELVLREIATGQDVDLIFRNNTILVCRKKPLPNSANKNQLEPAKHQIKEQRQLRVEGRVSDVVGNPLVGVSIKIIGRARYDILSGENGQFYVTANEPVELLFSMVGYESQQFKVVREELIQVTMRQVEHKIDEAVVTGYTRVRRDNFTGAATMVTRQELEKFNSTNIFTVLQALDPSFKVDERVNAGSNPNVMPQINIRGVSSVGEYAVNAPLIIMDGFEVPITTLYDIDVNRIETISILKDASSTSLYGSRGGNGVVVIETRLPKDGKFTVNYDMKPSVSMVDLSDYNLMNAAEKLAYEKFADLYTSKSGDAAWDLIQQEHYDNLLAKREQNLLSGVNTYWLKQPIRNTLSINHSLRMEGGENGVRYSLEGGYFDNSGVMKESGRTRGNAGFTLIYRMPNALTFRNVATYLYTKAYDSPYGNFESYTLLNPYEKIYDDQGKYNIRFGELGRWYNWGTTIFNPLYNAGLGFRSDQASQTLQNNMSIEWFAWPKLTIRASGTVVRTSSDIDKYKSPFHTDYTNITEASLKGGYTFGNQNFTKYEGRVDLQYSNNFGRHQFVANTVAEIRKQNAVGNLHTVTGYVDDRFMTPQMALQYAIGSLPTSTSLPVRSVGFLGSLFYTYHNKYNVSSTLRSDGASIYGTQNRFGTFWSAGFSYNMHNEEWFKNNILSRLRWYLNAGTSSTVSEFNVGMVSTSYNFLSGRNYYSQYAAIYSGQGNPAVRWPEQQQRSIGAELGVKGDFLKVDVSFYDRITNRMISTVNVAPSFGFYDHKFSQNLGKVQNKGFEAMANMRILNNYAKDFSWYISLGAVRNRSQLKEISNELRTLNESLVKKDEKGHVIQPSQFYQQGQSLGVIRAVPSLGIDPANGRELFRDRNGNVTYVWDANNQQVVGNTEASVFGNVGTSVNFKGLSIQIIGNYSLGGDIYNQTLMNKIENNIAYQNADRRVLEERWRQPGDKTRYKAIDDQSFTQPSSRFIQTESYLRLSTINVNYSFSNVILNRFALERLRLNFSMNDMFRWSTVRMERGISYPYAREFNFGVMVQF